MPWILKKKFRFEASHVLPKQGGKCARMHGHSWRGEVWVRGKKLYTDGHAVGMVADYGDIKELLRPTLENHLDHYHLNDSLLLENPTSEEVARWLWNELFDPLDQEGMTLDRIVIHETCTSECHYYEEV